MKLLFDENVSHKLVRLLEDLFPNSIHVRDIGLKAAGDPLVWEYAKDNSLMLVSKDSDMHQRSFLFGPPPKVIWVRLGNCTTSDVELLLRKTSMLSEYFTKTTSRRFSVYRKGLAGFGSASRQERRRYRSLDGR